MIAMRQIRPDDRVRLLAWRNDPDVARWMFTDHVITSEEHDQWFDSIAGDSHRRYWVVTLSGEEVGLANLAGIDRVNRRCTVGIYLASERARGTGAATAALHHLLCESFDHESMDKVICEALAPNERAIRLYEHMGFRREGYYRQHVRKGDSVFDVVSLALLREEFEACRPGIEARLAARRVPQVDQHEG